MPHCPVLYDRVMKDAFETVHMHAQGTIVKVALKILALNFFTYVQFKSQP